MKSLDNIDGDIVVLSLFKKQ